MSSQDLDPHRSLDEQLRESLNPKPGAASRVARGALAQPERPPGGLPRWGWLAASLFFIALVAAGAWWGALPKAPEPTPPVAAFHIENSGGLVTVVAPSGQVKALISGGSS